MRENIACAVWARALRMALENSHSVAGPAFAILLNFSPTAGWFAGVCCGRYLGLESTTYPTAMESS